MQRVTHSKLLSQHRLLQEQARFIIVETARTHRVITFITVVDIIGYVDFPSRNDVGRFRTRKEKAFS